MASNKTVLERAVGRALNNVSDIAIELEEEIIYGRSMDKMIEESPELEEQIRVVFKTIFALNQAEALLMSIGAMK